MQEPGWDLSFSTEDSENPFVWESQGGHAGLEHSMTLNLPLLLPVLPSPGPHGERSNDKLKQNNSL